MTVFGVSLGGHFVTCNMSVFLISSNIEVESKREGTLRGAY